MRNTIGDYMKKVLVIFTVLISFQSLANVKGYFVCGDYKSSVPEAKLSLVDAVKANMAIETEEMVYGEMSEEVNSEEEVRICWELIYASVLE